MTPGSIVTDFRKSQLVDPGWSKFDFDQNMWFSYSFKPNKAYEIFMHQPHELDTWANHNLDNLFI